MKKILIIGAGFLQSFVIKKAKEIGYHTLAVDADPNAPGFAYADDHAVINIVDEERCLEYARKEKIDGVLTAATDYGVLTAAYIAQEMELEGLKYDVAKRIKNKYETRKCLFENHVDDTKQAYLVDKGTSIEGLSKTLSYPVMVKPCDGSGSRGASKVENPQDLKTACEYAINSSLSHKAEIETFIDGKEYGVESIVIGGKPHVLAVMEKWMTAPPYYAELGHALPSDLSPEIEEKVKRCAENALKALGVNTGSVNMDILITKDGNVHIVDVGARMGGNLIGSHIIPSGTGIDYMKAMIENAARDFKNFDITKPVAVATKLLALTPGKVKSLPDFEEIARRYNVGIEHHLSIGDTINEYHTNLDGCGYVVATGAKREDMVKTAEEVLKAIDTSIIRK